MARREIVVLSDDLDGTDNDVRTVAFAYDGGAYEIDLSPANHDKLALALAPFIAAARKSPARGPRSQPAAPLTAADQRAFNQRVRDWAKAQGKQVSDRGRVPADIVDAYRAAGLR
ncbi:Lsr2 family protein [Catellatospora sp. TT07R-123]|uniref:histone-like nucleoid-structuring protein Lsr2 n=1 Tax=Catellatospora sp. TT07R-123 TaxID=2733863 RepID=UPI001B2B0829|nr:Lsr2 family protein [Catellatospora sp. TT07R-123]GHJ45886.1 Lsr2 family protein [Catellatospora sp. TT07R-123]